MLTKNKKEISISCNYNDTFLLYENASFEKVKLKIKLNLKIVSFLKKINYLFID